MTIALLVLMAAFQQPRTPAAGRIENYDSTVATIVAIGRSVADVKSALDAYRHTVFNGTNANVVQRAGEFRGACLTLASTADRGARTLCRSCVNPQIRPTLEQYRANLPRLGAVGRQCAARLRELSAGSEGRSAERLRRQVREVGNRIVLGFQPYEARLQRVREAFGWAAPATPTPRAN